jgi:hypothetical protein
LRGFFAAGVYLTATVLLGLSIFAVEDEQTGPGDAEFHCGSLLLPGGSRAVTEVELVESWGLTVLDPCGMPVGCGIHKAEV